ncbi:MAG: histidine kinase [Bacteroidales bacterium]|nr:histidine kinase [Bacteroidales bacterium]
MFQESVTSKRFKVWGIPLIGVLLTFVMHDDYELFTVRHLISVVISIIVTGVYWLSSNKIVVFLWNKYPWHLAPSKHILIEISLVLSLIGLLGFLNVWVASYFVVIKWESYIYQIVIVALLTFFLVSFHEAIFFYIQWKEHIEKSEFLEKANIESQYELLKSQVNPHFLFNSLNSLHNQLDGEPEAQRYIEDLSSFLRYSFNNHEKEIILVREEIEIVKKYYHLQKVRFGDGISLDINISEAYMNYFIPTLSLQMLIENCIKHNIATTEKPLNIEIFIHQNDWIEVKNNKQIKQDVISTKQGLANIKERYRFLTEKLVIINQKTDCFCVSIPLLTMTNKTP